mmetsp:Transcript_13920/g.26214  ORF Transcript_13920/g.26214 Transcript_13920/m.26214 type:complete len:202 (-) Transcript_13920:189-794(-)
MIRSRASLTDKISGMALSKLVTRALTVFTNHTASLASLFSEKPDWPATLLCMIFDRSFHTIENSLLFASSKASSLRTCCFTFSLQIAKCRSSFFCSAVSRAGGATVTSLPVSSIFATSFPVVHSAWIVYFKRSKMTSNIRLSPPSEVALIMVYGLTKFPPLFRFPALCLGLCTLGKVVPPGGGLTSVWGGGCCPVRAMLWQ